MISEIVTPDGRSSTDALAWFGGLGDIQFHKESAPEPGVVYWFIETDFGHCLVGAAGERLCYLGFVDGSRRAAVCELRRKWSCAVEGSGPADLVGDFGLSAGLPAVPPLLVRGTTFQLAVWRTLSNIGEGEVISYAGLARSIGRPAAARAVGGAVGANSIAWIIPCHRVVRGDGALGGYRWGVERKRQLLGSCQRLVSVSV